MRKVQLDGLRFILFVLVFLTHHWPERFEYFGYALPVFFVMSGFLITRVLLSAKHPSLGEKLKVFYLRRAIRIFPAYYIVVLLLWALGNLVYPYHYLTYLLNLKVYAVSLTPESPVLLAWLGGSWHSESLHLWSLSVEEQYYLVYPLLLYLTPARHRGTMLFTLLVLSVAARTWYATRYPQSYYGALLEVVTEYFVWGSLFAIYERSRLLDRLSPSWTMTVSGIATVLLVFSEFHFGFKGFYQFQPGYFQSPIALALGFFIWGLWSTRATHPVVRVLCWRPFVYLGEMSYTLYLVHMLSWQFFAALQAKFPALILVHPFIGTFLITLLMGMAIWHLAERPIYALRRYLPYGKSPLERAGTLGAKVRGVE